MEIKLFENAVNIWKKKHLNKTTFVKMTPVDVNQFNQRGSLGGGGGSLDLGDEQSIDICEAREKSRAWPIINVAVRTQHIIDVIEIDGKLQNTILTS